MRDVTWRVRETDPDNFQLVIKTPSNLAPEGFLEWLGCLKVDPWGQAFVDRMGPGGMPAEVIVLGLKVNRGRPRDVIIKAVNKCVRRTREIEERNGQPGPEPEPDRREETLAELRRLAATGTRYRDA